MIPIHQEDIAAIVSVHSYMANRLFIDYTQCSDYDSNYNQGHQTSII